MFLVFDRLLSMAGRFNFSKLSKLGDKLGLKNPRPPFEGAYIYILLFFIGVLIADFGTTFIRAKMLPVGGVTRVRPGNNRFQRRGRQASIFTSVKDKNIFNSDHFIPDSLGEKNTEESGEENTDPVPTSLPLKLVGTIIHGAPQLSVATVEVNGKDIQAVVIEDEVEDMARIREIQRFKVIFRNLRNRKLEYIEIKEENALKMGLASPNTGGVQQPQPEQTNFSFKRAEINKYLENLPRVLQDAKAVPYVEPGSGGEVSGFKLVALKSGSIYEKLGLKRGDIIKGVNGEAVDTPQKAMELYQALKSADDIQLEITRGGSPTTLNYSLE